MQSQMWRGQVSGASLHFTGATRVQGNSHQDLVYPTQFHKHGVRASAEREVKAKAVAAPPTIAADRLVPRVEERDGYYVLKEEFRQGINPSEKIKIAKEPMKFFMENEIEELAKTPFAELDSSKAGKDDIDVRLKWLGLFHRRKHQCEYNISILQTCRHNFGYESIRVLFHLYQMLLVDSYWFSSKAVHSVVVEGICRWEIHDAVQASKWDHE